MTIFNNELKSKIQHNNLQDRINVAALDYIREEDKNWAWRQIKDDYLLVIWHKKNCLTGGVISILCDMKELRIIVSTREWINGYEEELKQNMIKFPKAGVSSNC